MIEAPTDLSIAREILAARDERRQFPSFASRVPDWDTHRAYRVSSALLGLRQARGERPIGWKIGFTNRNIWPEYGVYAPIWGPMYDTTVRMLEAPTGELAIGALAEPRIEPEIVFGLERAPDAGADANGLLASIGWIAHGFEIVDSRFPGWKFTAADTIADGALHGRMVIGPRFRLADLGLSAEVLAQALATFTITLSCEGIVRDTGQGGNVLDSPLAALRHFLEGMTSQPDLPPVTAGSIVTTGTLTAALPVRPGERWQTHLTGLPLPGLDVRFA